MMVSSPSVFVNRLPRAVQSHATRAGAATCAAGREKKTSAYRASGGDRGVAALPGCPPKMLVPRKLLIGWKFIREIWNVWAGYAQIDARFA